MSVVVALADLHVQVERFGARALLVTTAPVGPPRVASVLVTVAGATLVMGAGRSSRANVAARPAVSVVWTAPNETEYCLIVDGVASAGTGDELVVAPASAVLHRLATAPDENR